MEGTGCSVLLTGQGGLWWEQPQSPVGLDTAFCRASMMFYVSLPTLIDSCAHKLWEDRQTSGIWRAQYSKFFIFGVLFWEFLNIRHICLWVLGALHGFLPPLKSAALVLILVSSENFPSFSTEKKVGKLFSGKILGRHL